MKTAIKSPAKAYEMLINGKFVKAADGSVRAITDPANGEKIAVVPEAGRADVKLAIDAARKAFDEGPWRKTTAQDRGKLLFKIGDLIRANAKAHSPNSRSATWASRSPKPSTTSPTRRTASSSTAA